MRLRYTLPALADLDSILTYIGEKSPRGAMLVRQRLKTVTELLLEYPRIGIPIFAALRRDLIPI